MDGSAFKDMDKIFARGLVAVVVGGLGIGAVIGFLIGLLF